MEWPSTSLRLRWAIGAALLYVPFALIGVLVMHHHGPLGVEERLAHHVKALDADISPLSLRKPHEWLLAIMVAPGEPVVFLLAIATLATIALSKRDWPLAIVSAGSPVVAVLLTELVGKPHFHRLHGHLNSFPSGHSTAAAALAVSTWMVIRRSFGPTPAKCATPFLIVMTCSTGIGVLILHWHYPTDVLGGWIVGTTIPLLIASIFLTTPQEALT